MKHLASQLPASFSFSFSTCQVDSESKVMPVFPKGKKQFSAQLLKCDTALCFHWPFHDLYFKFSDDLGFLLYLIIFFIYVCLTFLFFSLLWK